MWRIYLAIIGLGGFLCFYGYQEFIVGSGAAAEPVATSLVELEKGGNPKNTHVKLDAHCKFYGSCVAMCKLKKRQKVATNNTKVEYIYYPIISEKHPYWAKCAAVVQKYGEVDKVPENEWPRPSNFRVLVKSTKFPTWKSIPSEAVDGKSLSGLVINDIESITSEDKKLLSQSFSNMDYNKIIIVEEGRKPSSIILSLGIILGGGLLIVVGIGLFLIAKKK